MSQSEVLMPSMGEGVNEATLVKWLKQKGEHVDQDEPLLEVSTDKVDTEIPAPFSGVISDIKAEEGATVSVDQVLAIIATGDSGGEVVKTTAADLPPPPKAAAPSVPPKASRGGSKVQGKAHVPVSLGSSEGATKLKSSPLVRKIAKEKGINLEQIVGTGMSGRVTRKDLDRILSEHTRGATTAMPSGSDRRPELPDASAVSTASRPMTGGAKASHGAHEPNAALATVTKDDGEYLDGVKVKREKMSHMRKLIAEHMVSSVRVSPHVTTVFEVDLHKVVKIREQYKKQFAEREGFNLTYTHFLIHAAVQAIKLNPVVNTSIDGDEVLWKQDINVGCAVALESGLIVPVIKNAESLNLIGIARALNDLIVRAKTKKLKPDDVKGGTFSITNPGGYGSITSNPIINQPQVAILGIGAIVKKPVVIDDAIAIRPMMLTSLTFDHRAIDGEGGAKYLADMKRILENYDALPV